MMNIFWLCLVSFAFMVGATLYISLDELQKDDRGISERILTVLKYHKRRCIYMLAMLILLCGISVWLCMMYPSNSFLMNMKLISLISVLVVVNVTDIRTHIIPNKVILFAVILRMVYYLSEFFVNGSLFWMILKSDLLALLIVVFFFVVGVLIMKNGIGMGDIKLLLVLCIYQGISGVIGSLFYSLIIAFVTAVIMLISKKKTRKDAIAFAPSVLIGTVISVFFSGM